MPTVAAILAVIAVGHVAAVGVAVLVARHGVEVIAGGPDEERCVFGCRSGRCGDGLWLTQLWRNQVVDGCVFQYLCRRARCSPCLLCSAFTAATPVTWTVVFCPV